METAKFWLDFEFKSVDQSDGSLILRGYAATSARDRDKEMFSPDTLNKALAGYLTNPVVLLSHDAHKVIGKITSAVVDKFGVFVEAMIPAPVPGTEPWALKAYHDIKNGLYRAFSVGGMFGKAKDGSGTIATMDWMETSIVSVPSNPTALFEVFEKAFSLIDESQNNQVAPLVIDYDRLATAVAVATATKATPVGATPVDGDDDGDPPEGSYEDLAADLARALRLLFAGASCQVLATFPDYCIVAVYPPYNDYSGGVTPDYMRVSYSLDTDGEPVLGDTQPVQRMYVPGTDDDETAEDGTRAVDLDAVFHKAVLSAAARKRIPSDKFGYVDDKGRGHFPLTDAKHVRAALNLFSRADFPDAATKKRCAGKILAAARRYKIDVGTDSAVAAAAKSFDLAEDQRVEPAPVIPEPKAAAVLLALDQAREAREVLASLNAHFDAILAR